MFSSVQNSLSFVKESIFHPAPQSEMFFTDTASQDNDPKEEGDDVHFMEPRSFEFTRNLPSDPFLPPFEMLVVDEETQNELFHGNWLIIG